MSALRRAANRMHFDLVWRDYYSPIPQIDAHVERAWRTSSELRGIEWNAARQQQTYDDLRPHIDEFRRERPQAPFRLPNGSFERLDSEVLHAFVRRTRPGRVIELGAGYSTLVLAAAMTRNHAEGHGGSFVSYDPYPPGLIQQLPEGLEALHATPTQEIPEGEFAALDAGDILFLDTTHVSKCGSDVNRLLLDVLPALKAGVLVHFHDIYLPWEYPPRFTQEQAYYWNEQYAVQAFLTLNPAYEVLLANHWLARTWPGLMDGPVAVHADDAASFWLRRI